VGQDFLDITELVRSLQRTEGNEDCFRRGHQNCEQTDCAWRTYCLAPEAGLPVKPDGGRA